MTTENIFIIANCFFAIGAILLLRKIIENKNILRDFDFIGSILTTIGTLFMLFGYYQLIMFRSIVIALPTFLFWLSVSIFLMIKRYKDNKM